jgi:hypothetical protein
LDLRVDLGTSEERVRKGADKLTKFLNTKQQGRLDGFFTVKAKEKPAPPAKGKGKPDPKAKGTKRKVGVVLLYSVGQVLTRISHRETRKGKAALGRRQNGSKPYHPLFLAVLCCSHVACIFISRFADLCQLQV